MALRQQTNCIQKMKKVRTIPKSHQSFLAYALSW